MHSAKASLLLGIVSIAAFLFFSCENAGNDGDDGNNGGGQPPAPEANVEVRYQVHYAEGKEGGFCDPGECRDWFHARFVVSNTGTQKIVNLDAELHYLDEQGDTESKRDLSEFPHTVEASDTKYFDYSDFSAPFPHGDYDIRIEIEFEGPDGQAGADSETAFVPLERVIIY